MSIDPPTKITPSDIQEIAGVVPDVVINDFASTLGVEVPITNSMDVDQGATAKAKGFDDVKKKVKETIRQGYSASQILLQVGRPTWAQQGFRVSQTFHISCMISSLNIRF